MPSYSKNLQAVHVSGLSFVSQMDIELELILASTV